MLRTWITRNIRRLLGAALGLGVVGITAAQEKTVSPYAPLPRSQQAAPAPEVERLLNPKPAPEEPAPLVPLPGPTEAVTPFTPDSAPPAWWLKVPPVRPMPRLGNFPIPPSGPGYYSLMDELRGERRTAPPKHPYSAISPMPHSFFDADFRYLDDPKNTQTDWFDFLHRIHIGEDVLVNTGGEFRYRFMNENNSRLTGATNNYHLLRTRVYGDFWYQDLARAYVEFIEAHSFNQTLAPLPVDVNPADLLNAFMDFKIADWRDHPAYVRVGRQEMLLGSQRLVSPLDWANTRRTFDGVRVFRQGEKFDMDGFWMKPVLPNANSYDIADSRQNFAGGWLTYRPEKGHFLDFYYLFLNNNAALAQRGIVRAPFYVHTIGARYAGNKKQLLWDFENAAQFGVRGDGIEAAASTTGIGWNFADQPMNPTLWAYYDYASGDGTPNVGRFSTFNQLFAFGHYYLGWADQVARQNIHDFNLHLFMYPAKWITFWTQYHHFALDSRTDALYNAGGNATRRSAAGVAGRTVGNELDFTLNFHLGQHIDFLTGYSVLFPNDFIPNTGAGITPHLYYSQVSVRW